MRQKSFRMMTGPMAMCLLAGAFLLAAPGEAQAHARLVKSSPTADSQVSPAPVKVELWFSELLDGNFDTIGVFPEADVESKTRQSLTAEDAKVDDKDRTHLTVAVKPLPPGEYAVEWRVLSLDGHTATGRFKFKVDAKRVAAK